MKISARDIFGYHEIQGEILSSSGNTVTVRLTSPVSGPVGTFYVPINDNLLENAIPYAQAGLLSLYEDFKNQSHKEREYRYLLRPFFGRPYRYVSDEDYNLFSNRINDALTSKYLPALVKCACNQQPYAEITNITGLRICIEFTCDSGTRFIRNIGLRIMKDNAALKSTEIYTLLKTFFVDVIGYPTTVTQSTGEATRFIDKLIQEIPYAKIFLKKIKTTDILANDNWFYYYSEKEDDRCWIIQRVICGHNMTARINYFDGHQLIATLEGHPMPIQSHIFGESEFWGDEGKKYIELLLLRFRHIQEAVDFYGEEILRQYMKRESEIAELVKQSPTRTMEKGPVNDPVYESNAIEEWYNNLLLPYIFYPVHNGEEIIRYLQSEHQMRNE